MAKYEKLGGHTLNSGDKINGKEAEQSHENVWNMLRRATKRVKAHSVSVQSHSLPIFGKRAFGNFGYNYWKSKDAEATENSIVHSLLLTNAVREAQKMKWDLNSELGNIFKRSNEHFQMFKKSVQELAKSHETPVLRLDYSNSALIWIVITQK